MPSPRALIFSTIEGHASIAEAIQEGLEERGWETHIASFTDPVLTPYRLIYRYCPSLCRYYYKALYLPFVLQLIDWYTKKTHRRVFEAAVKTFPADLIISTCHGFDGLSLARQKKLRKEKQSSLYINILVDPRTFLLTEFSPYADLNCVFDQEVAAMCRKFWPTASVGVTGWFVRQRFRNKLSKTAERAQLGLDPHTLTILFQAGSEGEIKSARLIQPLLQLDEPLQIILACGSNQYLKQKYDRVAAQLPKDGNKKMLVTGFTPEIHRYMHAADLVVGKAGPNSIFEAVTSGTPFFATTHVGGQEDGNPGLILEYKIGYVEENLSRAKTLLKRIVQHPEELRQFAPNIQKLAEYNDHSMAKLVKYIEDLKQKQT